MLTTLIVPNTSPPSASVATRINASSVSSQSIGSQRRCVSQNSRAMIDRGADHRAAHVALHAAGDFHHKHRPAGVANHDALPLCFRLLRPASRPRPPGWISASSHTRDSRPDPWPIARTRRRKFPSGGANEHLLSLLHREAAHLGQCRHVQQVERIEGAPGHVHRRHGSGELFLGLGQHGLAVGRAPAGWSARRKLPGG